ncbi:MAG: hypothetical protein WKG01_40090 [Kofleriaceae bacterium]
MNLAPTIDSSLAAGSSRVRTQGVLAAAVLVAFTGYSLWVVAGHGYFGFLTLAGREPWAMQLLIDLVLACSFGLAWLSADARKRGIPRWPFVIATAFLGSVGLLGYLVYRALKPRSGT